ncbi:hypothetical protein RU98_GL000868 [Enterococcus caccae]|nr:hypothetical protein RU98_GL000868 [Enterococcus caccae]
MADKMEENQIMKASTEDKKVISPLNGTDLSADKTNKNPLNARTSIQTYANNSIFTFPRVTSDYNTPLDSKYSFFPRMNDDSKWYYESTYATSKKKVETSKGTISDVNLDVVPITDDTTPGVLRVTNVGMYNGVNLDLLVKVTYIKKVNDTNIWGTIRTPAKFELGVEKSNFLNLYMSGKTDTEINIAITTVKSDTTKQIKTSGVVTYNQITIAKKLILQRDQISNLYTPNDSIVTYDPNSTMTINNGNPVYTFQSEANSNLATNRIVQQYEDLATRAVGICMNQTSSSVTQILSATPPLLIKPPIPVMSGENTVTKAADSSAYTIYQVVPSQPSKVLEQFDLAIILPAVFKNINTEDISIKDQNGIAITNDLFNKTITVGSDGQQMLKISATEAYLNSNLSNGSGLYSNIFRITVPVKIDFTKDYSAYAENDPNGEGNNSKLIKVNGIVTLFSKDFGGLLGESESETPVVFTNQSSLTFDFRDENNKQVFQKSIVQTVGNEYDNTALLDEVNDWGFSLVSVSDNIKGSQTPEDATVKIILKDKRFDGNIDFYKNEQLLENNVLKYDDKITVSFNTIYNGAMEDSTFKGGQIITTFPKNVFKDEPSNMKLVDKNGKSVGTVLYQQQGDPPGRMVGKINEDVPVGTEVYLKYDGTVSSEQPANSDYKFIFSLITMDNAFNNQFLKDFSQDVIVKPNTAQLNVKFLDEKGNQLHDPYTSEENVGTPIDLTKLTGVTETIKELTNDNYILAKKPDNEVITIIDGKNDFTYQFSGTLKISSAPDILDFETKKATIDAVKYTNPTIIGEPLVISDTRADKVKWNLKARIDQPLTHSDKVQGDIIIPDAIKYKYQDDELTLTDQDTVIFSHLNTDSGSYNVTKERWSKGDGFMLDLQPGAVKVLGKYKAQITITLENAK